jgi:hypothetical protein
MPTVEGLVSGEVWGQFCDMIRQAGDVIRRPTAPGSNLERAEGYRYLTRLTQMAFRRFVEYGDPRLPYFLPNEPFEKLGIDNPDNVYLWATISGNHRYRISGRRGTVPYIGIGVFAGGFGGGGRRTIAHLNHEDLAIDPDGSFELLLGPDEETEKGRRIRLDRDASTILVRETFLDRGREVGTGLRIDCLDVDLPPPPLTAEEASTKILSAGMWVLGCAQIFAELSDLWASKPNTFYPTDEMLLGEMMGDPDLNYRPGYWKLPPEEAMVIEFVPPVSRCGYWSFVICNYWQESLDYRYRPTKLNAAEATYEDDGSVRIVVAHDNPGTPNWIDTESHTEGTMLLRFLMTDAPVDVTTKVVAISEL